MITLSWLHDNSVMITWKHFHDNNDNVIMLSLSCYHDNMLSYFFPLKLHTLVNHHVSTFFDVFWNKNRPKLVPWMWIFLKLWNCSKYRLKSWNTDEEGKIYLVSEIRNLAPIFGQRGYFFKNRLATLIIYFYDLDR
jgi:hypothetical protein